MATISRMLACALVATGLLALGATVAPEEASRFGLDLLNLPQLQLQYEEAKQYFNTLEALSVRANRRLDARNRAANEWVEGNINLTSMLRQFRELNEQYPESRQFIDRCYSGHSVDPDRAHTVEWLLARLRHLPRHRAGDALDRLADEMLQDEAWRPLLALLPERNDLPTGSRPVQPLPPETAHGLRPPAVK